MFASCAGRRVVTASTPASGFALEPPYLEIQAQARALAAEVEPIAAEADATSAIHPEVRAALTRSGLWELLIPDRWGGRSAVLDPLAICLTREILMPTSAQLDSLFTLQGLGTYAVSIGGDDALRDEWLPRAVTGEALASFALTEEQAGSDLRAVSTELRADGDELVLDGAKVFISNAGWSSFYSLLAREGDGYSMVLVPADSPGLSVEPAPEIISPHTLGNLTFDGVRLPVGNRLGAPGKGFNLVLATLSVFRVTVAGAALGIAQAALDAAALHAGTRQQFGAPLARLGAVGDMLADSWAELEAARLLTYRAAILARDDPRSATHHTSMAKLLATETAGRIVDRAVQIHGRLGLIRDSKVERLYRAARPLRVYEGASEVLRPGISRALVDQVMEGAR